MSKMRNIDSILDSVSITHKFNKDKLVFLNTSDVLEGKILIDTYMDVMTLKGQAKKTIKNDDILFSEIRPKNKRYAYVNVNKPEDYVVSTKLMVLRNKTKDVLTRYVYYFLTFDGTLDYLQMRAENRIGSFPQITFDVVKILELNVPDPKTQQKIVDVIFALDSKIELNNRINAELEAMAKTLYDYWFVQFDFPDKNGKPYKTSGGKIVWNEELKREIPEGWEVKRIEDFGEFKNGINYDPSLEGDTDAKIINVRNISSSNLFVSQYDLDTITLQKSNVDNYLVTDKDILIARSGIPGATRMMLEFAVNTIYCGFIIRFQVNNLIKKNYLFYFLKDMEKTTTSKSGGTIMPNVNQDTMKRMLVIEPNEKVVIKFNEFINPIFRKMNGIIQENQKLTELRDWILPMLMNGQVKVN
jgi:type I restriction enzyme S subunit